ncbi:hypothetical protein [Nostoc sp.]
MEVRSKCIASKREALYTPEPQYQPLAHRNFDPCAIALVKEAIS